MKRLLILTIAIAMILCGCNKSEQTATPQPTVSLTEAPAAPETTAPDETEPAVSDEVRIAEDPVFDYEAYDWAGLLLADAFVPGTVIGDAGREAVTLTVDQVTEHTITVTVTGPRIADALWSEYSQGAGEASLEDRILALLQQEASSEQFTLSYQAAKGQPVVEYTSAYASAVTCGLADFYQRVQTDLIEKMEASYE